MSAAAQELPPGPPVVVLESRRPWPLGVPSTALAVEALSGDAVVHAALMPAHEQVMGLLPAHLLDAVRNVALGHEDALGTATAQAWRALVADAALDAAFGVDAGALQAFIAQTVDAREKIVAASLFALDGEAGSAPLTGALARAIERFAERARFKAPPPRPARPKAALEVKDGLGRHARLLRLVFVLSMLLLLSRHLSGLILGAPVDPGWTLVGDPDRGHAFLAPTRADADAAELQIAIAELARQGFKAVRTPAGEWIVFRVQERP